MPKLEPREGLEVYVNEQGSISIKQYVPWDDDPQVVVFHPDDAKWLINAIAQVVEESKTSA